MTPSGRVPAARVSRWLLLAAAILLTAWSFVVPIFEAPDEWLHWQYARHLHDHLELPIYGPFFAEANSPPLSYALIAPVATRVVGPPPVVWSDGTETLVTPVAPRLHLNAEGDMWRYWPIRWARLITVLISLVTIAVCARLGAEAETEPASAAGTALLAAGFIAFLPQFAFRGSHVNHDVLMTTMAACTTWGMIVLMRRGFTWRVGVLTAVALATAYLSKINAISLAPALALAIVMSDPGAAWRTWVPRVAGVFAIALVIVAPWSIRNVMLYGDPFASGAMDDAVHRLTMYGRPLWDLHHVTTLPRELFKSFIGAFGYMGIKLRAGVYAIYLLFLLIAGAGLLMRAWRDSRIARIAFLLALIVICNYAVVVHINLRFDQPQGRYMFPALPAVMLAAALGVRAWIPLAGLALPRALIGAWAAANVAILLFVVRPAYEPPLVRALSYAVTTVTPQLAGQEWTADVSVPAEDAMFTQFAIDQSGGGEALLSRTLTGTVVFEVDGQEKVSSLSAPFQWHATPEEFPGTVTMVNHAGWRGIVKRVTVRWDNGVALRIRNVKLMGSLPGADF